MALVESYIESGRNRMYGHDIYNEGTDIQRRGWLADPQSPNQHVYAEIIIQHSEPVTIPPMKGVVLQLPLSMLWSFAEETIADAEVVGFKIEWHKQTELMRSSFQVNGGRQM